MWNSELGGKLDMIGAFTYSELDGGHALGALGGGEAKEDRGSGVGPTAGGCARGSAGRCCRTPASETRSLSSTQ